jgi:hypothetical protein
MLIDLTPSELLALRDIVADYLTRPLHGEVFVDVVNQVETTPEQLLQRLLHLSDGLSPDARALLVAFEAIPDEQVRRALLVMARAAAGLASTGARIF